jgi:NADP-dependent 3-hydroxy acid dehydrogenase YdfG
MANLINKNVFITGAASGIGLATAKKLHQKGYMVGMADLDLSELVNVTKDWNQSHIRLFELNVTDFEKAKEVLSVFCSEHESKLSILINNAGILEIGPFQNITNAQHRRILDVNVMGVINISQAAFPFLQNTKSSTVINLSSASSDYGIPELASYSASKFAVKALTEALEIEWAPHNINVCDVLPPFVSTNMVESQHAPSKVMSRLGVNLTADDVTQVILKQINSPKTHRTVGAFYGLLHRLSNVSPFFLSRLTMKFLSR